MLDYEVLLVKAIAQDPPASAAYLMSPQVNMGIDWAVSPAVKKFLAAIGEYVLSGSPISLSSILLHRDEALGEFTPEEVVLIAGVWKDAQQTDSIDLQKLVQNIKANVVIRLANNAIQNYQSEVKKTPLKAPHHISGLISRLDAIVNFADDYDPDPTTHYNDQDIDIGRSWGSKILDRLYGGGVPSMGYSLLVAPTGFGKSTFCRTVVANSVCRSVLGERTDALFSLNELKAGETSRRLKAALTSMWAGQRSSDDIDRDIRQHVKMYENVYSLAALARQISWWRPAIAVVDSLDALDYPPGTEYHSQDDKHKARAVFLADLSAKYNCFIVIPSNASSEHQKLLQEGKLHQVHQARAFGSMWYEAKAAFAAVMTQDPSPQGVGRVLIKTTKNRPNGESKFQIWPMLYSPIGKYYYDPAEIKQASLAS